MSANLANYLGILLLGGLLGLMGQGVRTVIGLKKMFDQADSQGVGQYDLFLASRLMISLFIGFIAGAAAAFFSGIKSDGTVDLSTATLTTFAAAGYAGSDFIEGLASRFTGKTGTTPPVQGGQTGSGTTT
jgi:putative chitinase